MQSVCWQDLYDSPAADMPAGGLLSETGVTKPAAGALVELRKMIQTQRAYEINSKAIQTSDQMLQRLSQMS